MTNIHTSLKPILKHVEKTVHENGNNPEAILEILKETQAIDDGLNQESISAIAKHLNIPSNHVYGISTFYSLLSMKKNEPTLRVCDGPACWLKRVERSQTDFSIGELPEFGKFEKLKVERTSCLGLCDRAPAALFEKNQIGPYLSDSILINTCQDSNGSKVNYFTPRPGELRIMLANLGKIDPDNIESAIKYGAYKGLLSALNKTPDEVIVLVEESGLQGRGGAGFPVGKKWRFVAEANSEPKYIIANADESEPLIFKDRVLMETNPHQLLEGMAICGYACGANEGFIYIRGEYEEQAIKLDNAIQQAYSAGWLGENIHNSGFSFFIQIHKGAGAYICGEETSLIESLEGNRGEPRLRPPYPPSFGFRGKPTCVNNVESLCAIPQIVENGSNWWKSLTNYSIPGTKLYMVLGHVKNPGIFEAPFGLTLRQIIQDFGGGLTEGSEFKFALTGGAAGTIVNSYHLDTPLDYSSSQKGISLGAGAFLICNQNISVVALLRELLHFFAVESCGKCTPCRIGTWRGYQLLTKMAQEISTADELKELKSLSENMFLASFCGLGQSVPIPINSAITNFPSEFHLLTRRT